MPAQRQTEDAGKRFVQALNTALRCVSAQRLSYSTTTSQTGERHIVTIPNPVSLRSSAGGPSGLFLDVACMFAIIETERRHLRPHRAARLRMHQFRLLDHNHEEILVYHWQPGPEFDGPDHPHLHISAALGAQIDAITRHDIDLDKLHVATGAVSHPSVIRMLIEEFKIAPQRPDWRETLEQVETAIGNPAG